MIGERIRFQMEMEGLGLVSDLPREFDRAPPRKQPPPCPRTVTIKVGKGRQKLVVGELRFSKDAKTHLLRHRTLLDPPDRNFIGWWGDQLGYDPNYKDPADPFRWEKLKFIIDSCQKIRIEHVKMLKSLSLLEVKTDSTTNTVTRTAFKTSLKALGASGLTVTTEALNRSIYPNEPVTHVSLKADTHFVFYETTSPLSSPDVNALAHELFGHLWLALRKAPYVHPKDAADIKARGTIDSAHNILDPFGNTYSGTVEDYLRKYVNRNFAASLHNPTLNVGPALYAKAFGDFTGAFDTKASGTLNGAWTADGSVYTHWESVGTNFELAPATQQSGVSQASIEKDATDWYAKQNQDKQYVFLRFLMDFNADMRRRAQLSAKLLSSLTRPTGMAAGPPPVQTFGGQKTP